MTLDNNFDSSLLEKIKEQKLQPIPLWHFLLKNYAMWALGVLSLSFGAISVSLILYLSKLDDLNLSVTNSQDWEDILLIFPLFWLLCSFVFFFAVFYNIKHTKQGYKYSPLTLFAIIIISSFILGFIVNAVGFGRLIDEQFSHHAPFYDRIMNPRINFWSQPNKGRLSGLILERQGTSTFKLVDKNQNNWTVEVRDGAETVKINVPMHFFGSAGENKNFKAQRIMPSMQGDGFFYRLQVKQYNVR